MSQIKNRVLLSSLALLFFIATNIFGQEDTVYVLVKSKYPIENGKFGSLYITINQKTFENEGDLLNREVIYNFKTYQPDTIIYHHYSADKLLKLVEILTPQEKLIAYKIYSYKKKNIKEIKLFSYDTINKKSLLVSTTKYSKKKGIQKIEYSDPNGLITSEHNQFSGNLLSLKTINNPDGTKELSEYKYDENDLLIEVKHTKYNRILETSVILDKYIYRNNQLNFIDSYNQVDNTLIKKVRYSYYPSGKLKYESVIKDKKYVEHYIYKEQRLAIYHPKREPEIIF